MLPNYNISLTINLPDGGRHARHLLNLYTSDMPAGILAAAGRLLSDGAAAQAQKFSQLELKRMEVWSSPEHSLKVFVLLSVCGDDAAFIRRVIAGYMESLPAALKQAGEQYLSSPDCLPDTAYHPTDWNVEVHPV